MKTTQYIFKEFLKRDGWTLDEANKEIEFIWLTGKIISTKDNYLFRTKRIGTSKILNRTGKNIVWNTLQNAINHSEFQM